MFSTIEGFEAKPRLVTDESFNQDFVGVGEIGDYDPTLPELSLDFRYDGAGPTFLAAATTLWALGHLLHIDRMGRLARFAIYALIPASVLVAASFVVVPAMRWPAMSWQTATLLAVTAAARWRRTPFVDRSAFLTAVADRLDDEREALARLAVREMGKPIRAARDEVAKCAFACRHYATHGARMLTPDEVVDGEFRGTVRYDPLGVILAVMPWNFPYWQVFRAAVPALAAGNAMVLKHASNVPRCALEIEIGRAHV